MRVTSPRLRGGKGLAGEGTEEFFASPGLALTDPPGPQRPKAPVLPELAAAAHRGDHLDIEAIIWTLKNQLGLEHHGGWVPAGLWARIVQRLLALNAVIWFNWQIGGSIVAA